MRLGTNYENAKIVEGFELLPEGEYVARVSGDKEGTASGSGNPMVNFEFTVESPVEFAGRKLFRNAPWQAPSKPVEEMTKEENEAWSKKNFVMLGMLKACKVTSGDTKECLGKLVRVKVADNTYTDKHGVEQTNSAVTRVVAAE